VFEGSINTLSSGRALIALKAYGDSLENQTENLIFESTPAYSKVANTNNWLTADRSDYTTTELGKAAKFDFNTEAVKFSSDETLYYQLKQIGFNLESPETAEAEGISVTKKILSADGSPLSEEPAQGTDVLIRIKARSTTDQFHEAIAIVDLLPGGFEIDRQSIRDHQNYHADYIDIREDRLVVYTALGSNTIEINYKARLTTSGEFTVPAVYANAMYNDSVYAHSSASDIRVKQGM